MSFMLTPWRSPWRNDAFALYFRGRIGDELRKVRINATSPRGVPVLEVHAFRFAFSCLLK